VQRPGLQERTRRESDCAQLPAGQSSTPIGASSCRGRLARETLSGRSARSGSDRGVRRQARLAGGAGAAPEPRRRGGAFWRIAETEQTESDEKTLHTRRDREDALVVTYTLYHGGVRSAGAGYVRAVVRGVVSCAGSSFRRPVGREREWDFLLASHCRLAPRCRPGRTLTLPSLGDVRRSAWLRRRLSGRGASWQPAVAEALLFSVGPRPHWRLAGAGQPLPACRRSAAGAAGACASCWRVRCCWPVEGPPPSALRRRPNASRPRTTRSQPSSQASSCFPTPATALAASSPANTAACSARRARPPAPAAPPSLLRRRRRACWAWPRFTASTTSPARRSAAACPTFACPVTTQCTRFWHRAL